MNDDFISDIIEKRDITASIVDLKYSITDNNQAILINFSKTKNSICLSKYAYAEN